MSIAGESEGGFSNVSSVFGGEIEFMERQHDVDSEYHEEGDKDEENNDDREENTLAFHDDNVSVAAAVAATTTTNPNVNIHSASHADEEEQQQEQEQENEHPQEQRTEDDIVKKATVSWGENTVSLVDSITTQTCDLDDPYFTAPMSSEAYEEGNTQTAEDVQELLTMWNVIRGKRQPITSTTKNKKNNKKKNTTMTPIYETSFSPTQFRSVQVPRIDRPYNADPWKRPVDPAVQVSGIGFGPQHKDLSFSRSPPAFDHQRRLELLDYLPKSQVDEALAKEIKSFRSVGGKAVSGFVPATPSSRRSVYEMCKPPSPTPVKLKPLPKNVEQMNEFKSITEHLKEVNRNLQSNVQSLIHSNAYKPAIVESLVQDEKRLQNVKVHLPYKMYDSSKTIDLKQYMTRRINY